MNISAIFVAQTTDNLVTESPCTVLTDSGRVELIAEHEAGIVSATVVRNGLEFVVDIGSHDFHLADLNGFREAFVPKGPRL